MNILDENIRSDQREMLRRWRIRVRHIGYDLFTKGVRDDEIIPLLQQGRRATFFTRDADFYRRHWQHARYCLVYLDVDEDEAAMYVRLLLRHPFFDAEAKRVGHVIRVTPAGLTFWRPHAEREEQVGWG
jgi:hypothetical protein